MEPSQAVDTAIESLRKETKKSLEEFHVNLQQYFLRKDRYSLIDVFLDVGNTDSQESKHVAVYFTKKESCHELLGCTRPHQAAVAAVGPTPLPNQLLGTPNPLHKSS